MAMRINWMTGKWDLQQPPTVSTGGTVTSIAGGVGITNTPEPITTTGTVDLDIFSLSTETVIADGDWFAFVDVSVGTTPSAQRKITWANLKAADIDFYQTVQDEGSDLTQRAKLNFIGAAVAATDNGGAGRTDVTVTAVTSVAGGVGITNTPEPIVGTGTVDLDINSLTTEATVADDDLFPFLDVSVGTSPSAQRKCTVDSIRNIISNSDHLTAWRQINTTIATTFVAVGMPGVATTGDGGTTNVSDSTGRWIRYAGTTALNNTAGWTIQASLVDTQSQFKPDLTWIVRLPAAQDIADVRVWVGMFSGDPMGSDTAGSGAGGNVMAYRYSTSAGDSTWQTYTEDGADANTVKNSGVSVTAGTIYRLRIKVVSTTQIEFYINGILVQTHTGSDTPPTGTVGLGTISACRNLLAGTARRIEISRNNMIEATAS